MGSTRLREACFGGRRKVRVGDFLAAPPLDMGFIVAFSGSM